jgi:hypothetical protein
MSALAGMSFLLPLPMTSLSNHRFGEDIITAREQFDVRWGSCEGKFRTIASFRRVLGSTSERNVAKVGVSDGGNLRVWILMVGWEFRDWGKREKT